MVAKVCCNEFSKSIFWAGVEEFVFKKKYFFWSTTCLEKMKKINCQKKFHGCAFLETEDYINSFQVDLPSPHCLKTSGFLYFQVVRKIGLKWVDHRKIFIPEMIKDFYQCRIQEWSYWYSFISIVSKALDTFRF